MNNPQSGVGGGTRIETHFRDGTLASLTGTAVLGVLHTNGFDSGQFYTQETKLNTNGTQFRWGQIRTVDISGH